MTGRGFCSETWKPGVLRLCCFRPHGCGAGGRGEKWLRLFAAAWAEVASSSMASMMAAAPARRGPKSRLPRKPWFPRILSQPL